MQKECIRDTSYNKRNARCIVKNLADVSGSVILKYMTDARAM